MQLYSSLPPETRQSVQPTAFKDELEQLLASYDSVRFKDASKDTRQYGMLRISGYVPESIVEQLPIGSGQRVAAYSSNVARLGYPGLGYGKCFQFQTQRSTLERDVQSQQKMLHQ
eukprot:981033-Amphidinium_carterae.1